MVFSLTELVLSYLCHSLSRESSYTTMKATSMVTEGREDPFQTQLNLLRYIFRGVKVEERKMADSYWESLPISPIIYRKIKAVECKSM